METEDNLAAIADLISVIFVNEVVGKGPRCDRVIAVWFFAWMEKTVYSFPFLACVCGLGQAVPVVCAAGLRDESVSFLAALSVCHTIILTPRRPPTPLKTAVTDVGVGCVSVPWRRGSLSRL